MNVSAFDRWLAKPTTTCLLRRLLSSDTDIPVRNTFAARHGSRRHRRQSTAAALRDDFREWPKCNGRRDIGKNEHDQGGNTIDFALKISLEPSLPWPQNRRGRVLPADVVGQTADKVPGELLDKTLSNEVGKARDLEQWSKSLRIQQLSDGHKGVAAVWYEMRESGIDLPVTGEQAHTFWQAFTATSVFEATSRNKNYGLLHDVFEYAKDLKIRTGLSYGGLYRAIVGPLLVHEAENFAQPWHKLLIEAELAKTDAVIGLAPDIMRTSRAKEVFRDFFTPVYQRLGRRDLYDVFIREALEVGDDELALSYHRLFLDHGDVPGGELFKEQGVQRLFDLDRDQSLPVITTKRALIPSQSSTTTTDAVTFPPLTRESMSRIVGEAHGIKAKDISDAFCARLFATRTFSIDLIIKSLSFFGIQHLGSASLRQLALRASTSVDFTSRLGELAKMGITTTDTGFSRLITAIAKSGSQPAWMALVMSDQHPDNYDDMEMQETILALCLAREQWSHAHVALISLSLGGSRSSKRAWNRLLQHYIQSQDFTRMLSLLKSMHDLGVTPTKRSLVFLHRIVLPKRRHSRLQQRTVGKKSFDVLAVVTNACVRVEEGGQKVSPRLWVEILKRFGMESRWDDFERLVLWLIRHYSYQADAASAHSHAVSRADNYGLSAIFDHNMQKAIFAWGFRAAAVRKALQKSTELRHGVEVDRTVSEPWAKGLQLLVRMKDSGVRLDESAVRQAFEQRMWILFGPGNSIRRINNEMRQINCISLASYITHANSIWPNLVSWVPHHLLEDGASDPQLLPAFFGIARRTSMHRREYADVRAWAEGLDELSHRTFSIFPHRHNLAERQRTWHGSPFRRVLRAGNFPRIRLSDYPS